jgi:hypothetical protein
MIKFIFYLIIILSQSMISLHFKNYLKLLEVFIIIWETSKLTKIIKIYCISQDIKNVLMNHGRIQLSTLNH